MSDFEYTDLGGDRVRVTYGVHGRVVRIISAGHKGLNNRQAYLPADPAQRLAMAEAIVGGPLIEVGDLPEVEVDEVRDQYVVKPSTTWTGRNCLRSEGVREIGKRYFALAQHLDAREKADAEAKAAEDARVERVADAISRDWYEKPFADLGPVAREVVTGVTRAAIAALDADQ